MCHVSAEQINATEEKFLKNSIISQWWQWMQQLLQLNLGRSFETKEPVTQSLFEYAPPTLLISFSTLVLSLAISIPLGVLSARHYHKLTDKVIRTVSTLSISLPAFSSALFYYSFSPIY